MKGMSKKKKKIPRTQPEQYHQPKGENAQQWLQKYFILFATIGVLVALKYKAILSFVWKEDNTNLTKEDILQRVRNSELVELAHGKLLATDYIPIGTELVEIPREMMIWDLDAVRHPFIRDELFQARLEENIDTAERRMALLSAYMALLRNKVISPVYDTHASVVKVLPSYEEYASFHPVLVELSRLEQGLGGTHSPGYQQIISTREQIHYEYNEFVRVSKSFATQVSIEDYLSCRIAVQSRAFHTSEIAESEAQKAGPTIQEEKEYYRETMQINFDEFAIAIVPVNDWMNSHANNNVEVGEYDPISRTWKANTIKSIPKGGELINNYGDRFDAVLFSQYGYVPFDGSGTTFARLYPYHDISLAGFQHNTEPPREHMLRYLQRDYGYFECIQREKHPEAAELKRLKSVYLQKIGTDIERWSVSLPQRTASKKTPISTIAIPRNYKVPFFGEEIDEYLESAALKASLPCRLITLTHRDLDGRGETILKEDIEALNEESLDALLKLEEAEITMAWMTRTLHCMHTLASVQKQKYNTSVNRVAQEIIEMSKNSSKVETFEWNAAHLKLGEMQSQEAIEDFTLLFLENIEVDDSSEDFFVRNEPCPWEYSKELLL